MSGRMVRALKVGSVLVAIGCAAIMASQAVAAMIAVQVFGTVLHHMLG